MKGFEINQDTTNLYCIIENVRGPVDFIKQILQIIRLTYFRFLIPLI